MARVGHSAGCQGRGGTALRSRSRGSGFARPASDPASPLLGRARRRKHRQNTRTLTSRSRCATAGRPERAGGPHPKVLRVANGTGAVPRSHFSGGGGSARCIDRLGGCSDRVRRHASPLRPGRQRTRNDPPRSDRDPRATALNGKSEWFQLWSAPAGPALVIRSVPLSRGSGEGGLHVDH